MEDNEYNLGVTEDSSSHVSSGWSEEAGMTGQGGDSSMLVEATAGESMLDGDSNSRLEPTDYLQSQLSSGKTEFEWSAARGSPEVLQDAPNGGAPCAGGIAADEDGEDTEDGSRVDRPMRLKRPFAVSPNDEDSASVEEKRPKKEKGSVDGADTSNTNGVVEDESPDTYKADAEGEDASNASRTSCADSSSVPSGGGAVDGAPAGLWTAFDTIQPKVIKSEQLPDLEKFWRPVIESPKDFQAWTSLLQYVDHENDVAAAREAYDSFLKRYPYCYGYWKKWADYEKKKAMKKDCEKVFERGLTAVPLSVDLWLHYLNYCRVHHAAQESFVREQFERAIAVCGLEFRSDRLWELYINWEVERDDLRRVFNIYDILLSIPTQFHRTHWDNLQDLVNQNDPKELLSADEYQELKLEIFTERKISTEVIADIKLTEEEIQAIRKKTNERRQAVHSKTEKEIADRWTFEEGIKRPYFHVKPLERGQLKNWRSYLEFEIGRGHQSRIDILFERCLIACALYDEYWLLYAQHLESRWMEEPDNKIHIEELLRCVYRRACTVHVYDKPTLYLMWATFEEKTSNLEVASMVLDLLEKVAPKLDSLAVRRVNLARRQGDHERVLALYRKYIDGAKKDNSSMIPLSLRASRFAAKVLGDDVAAEEFIEKALEKEPRNVRLYIQLFDIRFQKRPIDVPRAVQVIDRALKSKLDLEQRCRFALRKVEFLEDFGSDVEEIVAAQEAYQKLVKKLQNDRQAKAAAQLAQQQASATNATTTTADSSSEASKETKGDAANSAYTASYDSSSYGTFQGQQGYPGYQGYPGWTGYQQYGSTTAWAGQGSYYPQQYGQQQ